PYRYPWCRAAIGRIRPRRAPSKEQIPEMLKQGKKLAQVGGQQRNGARKYERGYDPSRYKGGRRIGSRAKYPVCPRRCRKCLKRITPDVARILKKRWFAAPRRVAGRPKKYRDAKDRARAFRARR